MNPRDDTVFVGFVETVSRDAQAPGDLEIRLRERYPYAVVRARDLDGEPRTIWYVYRDGHWTPSSRGAGGDDHV